MRVLLVVALAFVALWSVDVRAQTEVPVTLPGAVPPDNPRVDIDIGPDAIMVDGQVVARIADGAIVDPEGLGPSLEAIFRPRREGLEPGQELEVMLNADRDVTHGVVVSVLDAVRELGITRFALSVAPAEPEPR